MIIIAGDPIMLPFGIYNVLHMCESLQTRALMVAGYPLLFRGVWGMRAALIPALTPDCIQGAADVLKSKADFSGRFGGIIRGEAPYRGSRFYFAIFGEKNPFAIIAGRLSDDAPPGSREQRDVDSAMGTLEVGQILRHAEGKQSRETILAPGCPPFLLSRWGIHAVRAKPVAPDDLSQSVRRMSEAPTLTEEEHGFHSFDIRLSDRVYFRSVIFGYPSPTLAVYLRLPDGGPSRPASIP